MTAFPKADRAAFDSSARTAGRPLVIDVDGTLLHADLTFESLIAYVKPNPLRLFHVVSWLRHGLAHMKRQLADRVEIDTDKVPADERVVALARSVAESGREVYLATASDAKIVGPLQKRFPFLSGIFASDGSTNLKSRAKAGLLQARFPQGFDYAGNSGADVAVWEKANAAIVVNASPHVEQKARAVARVTETFAKPPAAASFLRSLRLHQTAKNLLVFAPIVLGGQLGEMPSLLATTAAFIALCLVASATYLVNDVLDIAEDRKHWSKQDRPIAAGRLLPGGALTAAAGGIAAGFAIAALLSWTAVAVLGAYVALTLAYSLGLKRMPLVDGLVLATLFTFRLALGVAASGVPPSPWLFVFSMFIFTSLSFAKRYTELGKVIKREGTRIAGRGYRAEDAPLVLALGVAAGLSAVIITIFYIIDDAFRQSFYGRTAWLWGFPPLTFLFICRTWLISVRGEMSDDPVEFALKDVHSRILILMLMVCFAFAWLG